METELRVNIEMITEIDTHALRAITSLQRPGKPNLLNRIVELFKSETPKTLNAMQAGLEASNLRAVRDAAHTLKSSSAYVGATELSQRCRDLESAARDQNFPACIALSDDVEDLFNASVVALDDLLRKAA